jgi:hypothetical protein
MNQKNPPWRGLIEKRIARHFRQFHSAEGFGRRSFLRRTAGAAGLALTSGLWMPELGRAQDPSLPKPIPGGAVPLGFLVHHYPLPTDNRSVTQIDDPSEITDFNGVIGDTRINGSGTGIRGSVSSTLSFRADMGFMDGEYVGVDGEHHHGTFVFV